MAENECGEHALQNAIAALFFVLSYDHQTKTQTAARLWL